MGLTLAQVVKNGLKMPHKAAVLGSAAPTLETQAMGKIPDGGVVSVQSAAAVVHSIMIYSVMTSTWIYPGTDSGSYQKTFTTDGNLDFFEGPAGAKFFIFAASGTPTVYHSGDDL